MEHGGIQRSRSAAAVNSREVIENLVSDTFDKDHHEKFSCLCSRLVLIEAVECDNTIVVGWSAPTQAQFLLPPVAVTASSA